MRSIQVDGPCKVSGTVEPGGNKNAALPIIAACMLTKEPVVIHNMPDILDVRGMLKLAAEAGAKVVRCGSTVTIEASDVTKSNLPPKLCASLRASVIFGGALAARCGESSVGLPGGDFIGRRRLDSHYYGLGKLGIGHELKERSVYFKLKKHLAGADIFLDEASVTATEHILIAAAAAKGTTILRNAASEPHVQQLAELLTLMGAKVSGADTNTITIEGASELHGCEFTIDSDHIEAATYLSMAAATRGGVEIIGKIQPRHYWMTRRVFERFGIKFKLEPNRIFMPEGQRLVIKKDAGNAIPVIADGTWPQFPSDMMSCMIVAATQAKGTALFFEKMFESRIYFVDRLIAMGANAVVCDPHRVVISGPSKLTALEMSSPDIRAGMALVAAAVCARGRSIINNADMIFRGYENIVEKLQSLGVDAQLLETM